MSFDSKMTVSQLLTHHPSAADVFFKGKMLSVGCPAETFHTVEDIARIYGMELKQLLKQLRGAVDARGKG